MGVDITATFGNLGLDVFGGLLAILLAVLSWAIGYGQRKEENKFRQVKAGNYVLDFCSMKEIQVNSLPAGFLKD